MVSLLKLSLLAIGGGAVGFTI